MFPRGANELGRGARCGKASFLQLALEFLMMELVDRSIGGAAMRGTGQTAAARSPWTPAKASRAARNFPPAP
jgi:hypothetical protein